VRKEEHPSKRAPEEAPDHLKRIRIDTYIGMAFSNAVAFFIILTAAATLNANGSLTISTAGEAAEALRPIAGDFAFLLFTIGIVGTGFLALPMLAGSAAYAVGELMRWPIGLHQKPYRAKGFYCVMAGATLTGLVLDALAFDPIKALFWAAVINGVAAVPVMIIMMLIVSSRKMMMEDSG
jgi:Mn2+/Fe2+ NRAMP family transporter